MRRWTERGRAGHQPQFTALAQDLESARLPVEVPHGEAQGLGDPQAGLEEQHDQEGIPLLVAPPAAPAQLRDLRRGEVGHQAQSLGRQAGLHGQHR